MCLKHNKIQKSHHFILHSQQISLENRCIIILQKIIFKNISVLYEIYDNVSYDIVWDQLIDIKQIIVKSKKLNCIFENYIECIMYAGLRDPVVHIEFKRKRK